MPLQSNRLRCAAWLLMAGLACTGNARAAEDEGRPPPLVRVTGTDEGLDKNLPVAGEIVKGLYFAGPDGTKADPDRLSIWVANSEKDVVEGDFICVSVASRDGRYRGKASFLYPATPGFATVDLDSQYSAKLGGYEPDELAVRAFPSRDCDAAGEAYFIASWAEVPDESQPVRALINSQGARLALHEIVDGQPRSSAPICERFEANRRRAYDHECTLPPASDDTTATDRAILIDRRRLGDRLPAQWIRFDSPTRGESGR